MGTTNFALEYSNVTTANIFPEIYIFLFNLNLQKELSSENEFYAHVIQLICIFDLLLLNVKRHHEI